MSFREFGFEKDDEEFFKDVFDSTQRYLQLARYSGARWRNMLFFYGSTLFFVVSLLLYYAFEERGIALLMALVSLSHSMMSLSRAMADDGKYKMARIVDEFLQQLRSEGGDQDDSRVD